MINKIPKNFCYSDSTKNLFLFYQRSSELLFDYSPDSYKVSSHNAHSLISEAHNIFLYLKKDGCHQRFYAQYIPDILEELIFVLRTDNVSKLFLGLRFQKYIQLLEQCKNAHGTDEELKEFETVIVNLRNYYSNKKFYNYVKERLRNLICGEKNEQELITVTDVLLCELIFLGYSKQHIYNAIVHFFSLKIDNAEQAVEKLFLLFEFQEKEWEIITFANKKLSKYYQEKLHEVIQSDDIKLSNVSNKGLAKIIESNPSTAWLKETLANLNSAKYPVSLIRAKVKALDPYSAYEHLESFLSAINELVTLFDNEIKLGYSSIACLNYPYKKVITIKRAMEMRPKTSVDKDYAARTAAVLKKMRMSRTMFHTFLKAAEFHSDALNKTTNDNYTLVILWTALEALFVDNSTNTQKSKLVIDGLIAIIQRTYVVKTIKWFQYDLIRHLREFSPQTISKYHLDDLRTFVDVLFDPNQKQAVFDICKAIENNLLLRSRVYYIVDVCCKNSQSILDWLEKHQKKVEWQIKRIYRTRNIIVHTGNQVPYVSYLVDNLHNYIDFILNFIICKSWHGDNILDIKSLIAEVKTDNEIHYKLLHDDLTAKTSENILKNLFGPSSNILEYYADSEI